MVDWNDPQTIAIQNLAVVKLLHFLDGVFVWEFLSTLYFEWDVYIGKRQPKIPMIVYIICRWTTLGAVLCDLVGFNLTQEYNCAAWFKTLLVFSYIGLGTASILIVLRGIALWERKIIPSVIVVTVWLLNVGWLIRGIATSTAAWNPLAKTCVSPNVDDARNNVIVTFVSDVVLLVIYIFGTIRRGTANMGGIWRLIFKQGLIWVALATLFELPPAIFLIINLNTPMDLMFQTPALISMTICATRMFRDLTEFASKPVSGGFSTSDRSGSNRHLRGGTPATVSLPMARMDTTIDSNEATSRTGDMDSDVKAYNGKFELTRSV